MPGLVRNAVAERQFKQFKTVVEMSPGRDNPPVRASLMLLCERDLWQ